LRYNEKDKKVVGRIQYERLHKEILDAAFRLGFIFVFSILTEPGLTKDVAFTWLNCKTAFGARPNISVRFHQFLLSQWKELSSSDQIRKNPSAHRALGEIRS
jgi:hypothetical protein